MFKECCKFVNIEHKMLLRPVATCWNTHGECLTCHLEMREGIQKVCTDGIYRRYKLHRFALASEEWKILEQMQSVLAVSFIFYSVFNYANLVIGFSAYHQTCVTQQSGFSTSSYPNDRQID
jgi:hypothetical protein